VAVIKKICDVLIQLGVQPANIVLVRAVTGRELLTEVTPAGGLFLLCDVNDKTSTRIRAVIATRPA